MTAFDILILKNIQLYQYTIFRSMVVSHLNDIVLEFGEKFQYRVLFTQKEDATDIASALYFFRSQISQIFIFRKYLAL